MPVPFYPSSILPYLISCSFCRPLLPFPCCWLPPLPAHLPLLAPHTFLRPQISCWARGHYLELVCWFPLQAPLGDALSAPISFPQSVAPHLRGCIFLVSLSNPFPASAPRWPCPDTLSALASQVYGVTNGSAAHGLAPPQGVWACSHPQLLMMNLLDVHAEYIHVHEDVLLGEERENKTKTKQKKRALHCDGPDRMTT